jgi:hypothetical protein
MFIFLSLLVISPIAQDVAATIESDVLLKPPAGLNASFTVANRAPRVDVTLFTGLPTTEKGTLWSSWGDGCVARNGKYYTSLGDHRGTDANSYVYEYDRATKKLRRVVDVARAIGQKPGVYGHGKIHSGIHEADDGWLYFSTYWGKHREVEAAFGPEYQGSLLLRYHPETEKVENLGAIVPRRGLPASYFDARRGLLYFHAVYDGGVSVYDVREQKVKFVSGESTTEGNRAFMGDARGRVFFTAPDGTLHYYDPDLNKIVTATVELPATEGSRKSDTLRAATEPTRAGLLFGMTQAGRLFSFDSATQSVTDLGPNFGDGVYTAVMAVSPDDRFIYFAPGAHGSGVGIGSPIVQYNVATGERKVLAFLNAALREKLNYNLGGTYNLKLDTAGERLFVTFNGATVTANARKQEAFGQPCVVVLHVPKSER